MNFLLPIAIICAAVPWFVIGHLIISLIEEFTESDYSRSSKTVLVSVWPISAIALYAIHTTSNRSKDDSNS